MKITRTENPEGQEPDPGTSLRSQVHKAGKSVDLIIALLDRMCPSVFLHITIIGEHGGGVSVSRVSDGLPEHVRSQIENLNSSFANEIATVFGGDARAAVATDSKPGSLAEALDQN